MLDDFPTAFHHLRIGLASRLSRFEGRLVEMATDEALFDLCASRLQGAYRTSRGRAGHNPLRVHDLFALKSLISRAAVGILFGIVGEIALRDEFAIALVVDRPIGWDKSRDVPLGTVR